MNEHVDYKAKEAGAFTRFLWYCAGADEKILKYSSYSDHVKYEGIGGIVLATAVLGFLSMSFAIQTIFENIWVTVPIATVWALIVFNLDRFIVSSTGKGDGKDSIHWKEGLNALPRLFMAVILGLAISAPLETYIFRVEIDRELENTKRQSVQMKIGQIETKYQRLIKEADSLRMEKKLKLEALEPQKSFYADEVMKETNVGYCGPKCQQKQAQQKKFEDETYNPALKEFQKAEAEWKALVDKKKQEQEQMDASTMVEKYGFLDRLLALEKLSEEKTTTIQDPISGKLKEEVVMPSGGWPIWIVRLLFMIIEIAPVILKLMLIKGPYDYMSENVNQILETKQGISMEPIKDENNKMHMVKDNFNPKRIMEVVKVQNELEAENAKLAITLFAQQEQEKIRQNPDKFIQNNGGPTA
jgi:hypothetical protein